ncbi:tetratricopeptide repeat-containing sensor histidine kinase [Tenacibaculum mesophilum]|uniref:tetratricopeptide repeat-containing sensor histidine kinase n=1 Tax=Tenacibaculum mesophilum TaxID=104268 RepID=UPI002491743C|nr:tetratricopeptide repeat-containing sensor histidine kinase [Tenacibaculum mesophilum]
MKSYRSCLLLVFITVLRLDVYPQESNFLYERGKEICLKSKNEVFCKAIEFYNSKEYDSCYAYSNRALMVAESNKERDFFNCIQGYSAFIKKLYSKALSSISEISEEERYAQIKLYLLGNIYLNSKKYDRAVSNFEYWIKNDSTSDKSEKKAVYHNLGLCYVHKKDYIKAKEYFNKELSLIKKSDTLALIRAKMDLANVYYNQYLDDEAIPLFKEAYDLAKLYSDLELRQNASENMAYVEKNRKRYKESVNHFIETIKWKDSIWNRDKIWELTEKDKQLAVAQKQQEIVLQEEQLKRQAVVQKSLVIGASGLLVFLGFLGYFYRELKSKNKFITQQKEELNVANKTKDYLFSVVSHDLRSPINTIKRQHEKLKRQLKNKEYDAVSETTNNAIALTESTSHLLNNVLHWSLEQNNQLSFKAEEYPLKPLVEQAVYNFEEIAEAKNIALTTTLEATILVKADKESLKIVLRNLLDNALKYTGENGKIEVKTYKDSEEFSTIEIKDTGFGISEEKLAKIKRLEDLSIDKINRSEGVGLGMLLCQTLIKKNNGKLLIDSELEVGTTIRILLPNASA